MLYKIVINVIILYVDIFQDTKTSRRNDIIDLHNKASHEI